MKKRRKKTQLELVKKIAELAAESPNAQIRICVGNEFAEEFSWTAHKIDSVDLCCYIIVNEIVFTSYDDAYDEIVDVLDDDDADEVLDYFDDNSVPTICVFTSAS